MVSRILNAEVLENTDSEWLIIVDHIDARGLKPTHIKMNGADSVSLLDGLNEATLETNIPSGSKVWILIDKPGPSLDSPRPLQWT